MRASLFFFCNFAALHLVEVVEGSVPTPYASEVTAAIVFSSTLTGCGENLTTWAAGGAECAAAMGLIQKHVCTGVKELTPTDYQGIFDCEGNAASNTHDLGTWALDGGDFAQLTFGQLTFTFTLTVKGITVDSAGTVAQTLAQTFEAGVQLATSSLATGIASAVNGNASLVKNASAERIIDIAGLAEGSGWARPEVRDIAADELVPTWKPYVSTLTGIIDMTADFPETCDMPMELVGNSASSDCIGFRHAMAQGICDALKSGLSTSSYDHGLLKCGTTYTNVAVEGFVFAARRRRVEEDNNNKVFLSGNSITEKRKLADVNVQVAYTIRNHFMASDEAATDATDMQAAVWTFLQDAGTAAAVVTSILSDTSSHLSGAFTLTSIDQFLEPQAQSGGVQEKSAFRTFSIGFFALYIFVFFNL